MKILVTQGYGSGWSSFNSTGNQAALEFMLTCPYLIEHIEQGGKDHGLTPDHPLVKRFLADLHELGYTRRFLPHGARNLAVVDVEGPFTIEENNGLETIIERDTFPWTVLSTESPTEPGD